MPLNKKLKKVMVIGSGPIVIGQAAEFDYAGTQACRALKEEGLEVVLVNSNPATIMTDNKMADSIYIEPLSLEVIERIILKEKPDGLLSTLGGQTGLTLSMQLAKAGFLEENNVMLLGANPETIDKAEDRQLFKDTMESIGQPCIPSKVVNDVISAVDFAEEIDYPVIIRPAFTLGGTGGGIVHNEEELREIAENGLRLSPITQVLVEKCISGWKEIEFEVIRDSAGNVITVCSMENFDPVGIHTGDSIVIAPAVTLSDKEYQMLRKAALDIVTELKVEGGCNCQFALHPESFEYAVIEVNPRVSRSSALASKATGYPIAKVASKIAIGYRLDEIKNAVTGNTYACFEPALDYVVVKFPKWPFDKFVYAKRNLGTQMKATGEVMAIGQSFEEALMKAVRGAEIGHKTLDNEAISKLSDEDIFKRIDDCDDERLFLIYQAFKRGIADVYAMHERTMIDEWFLYKLMNIINMENRLKSETLTDELYLSAKKMSFLDNVIENFSGQKIKNKRHRVYKMVDTCAAEFNAETPYFYSTFDEEDEAKDFIEEVRGKDKNYKGTIIVFGSGPIRIGQGIEFDYASVQCVWSLKKAGYEVVIVNNNPETVSTDFDTADRLYFEALTNEDVMDIIHVEKPEAVVVAFGGQTAIKLTKYLNEQGIKILGTPADSIDMAEDRERFDELLEKLNIKRAFGETVMTTEEALKAANDIGYPVLMRPSYVLGGQNMIIAFDDNDIKEYMEIILRQEIENPILIDKYLMGIELEIDAICDGEDILIPGIMEHIERTGIHSGDSIAVYPAWNLTDDIVEKIVDQSKKLALSMKTLGLVNIQYLIYENKLYVIEVNPRSSRTIPYITKVTGVPMVDLATRAMLGKKLEDMGYGTGLYRKAAYYAVKVPVFSFEKLLNVDTHLGPEMKSTGEVLGLASTLEEALYKGLIAAGYRMKKEGGVLFTVRDRDKDEIADIAKGFSNLGFKLYATEGTARVIEGEGMTVHHVDKIHESDNNGITLLESGKVDYIISTSSRGRIPTRDSVKIRRKAVERAIPCLTSMDTATALIRSLRSKFTKECTELVNINDMRSERQKLHFTKMSGTQNDYIYLNCFNQHIDNPEGLSVILSDRHIGIGGDGIVMILPSKVADASMKLINKDGKVSGVSENALRCIGKYLYDKGISKNDVVTVEADGIIHEVHLVKRYGEVVIATVEMGKVTLKSDEIPVNIVAERVVNEPVTIGGRDYNITCVNIGSPHCVVFVKNVDNFNFEKIGPMFANNEIFPAGTNVEFVKVVSNSRLKIRAWTMEKGESRSFGQGACAAAIAAVENKFCKKDSEITVQVIGGELKVRYDGSKVSISGDTKNVFEGEIEV